MDRLFISVVPKKNNVLVLEFDKYGILSKKDFYNKENMKKLSFARTYKHHCQEYLKHYRKIRYAYPKKLKNPKKRKMLEKVIFNKLKKLRTSFLNKNRRLRKKIVLSDIEIFLSEFSTYAPIIDEIKKKNSNLANKFISIKDLEI